MESDCRVIDCWKELMFFFNDNNSWCFLSLSFHWSMCECVPQRRGEADPLREELGETWGACGWLGWLVRPERGESTSRLRFIHPWQVTPQLHRPPSLSSTQTFPPKLVLLDFGDMESMPDAIAEILECYGCLDVLILNSSMKVKAPAQSLSLEMDKLLMDSNYFGPVTLAKGDYGHFNSL